ncbi:MAG: hypothetical protein K2N41_05555 [Lachnospiraceae bacterium]|nr:hypothetical protein [Lachnospiraceae bacterium]MDE7239162.1 hypothetical protein [Lachnospiraceae bacterium]
MSQNKDLEKVIFEKKHKHRYVEEMMIGGIIIPLIQMNGYHTYIYGAGKGIEEVVSYLWYNDIKIEAIIDNDPNKRGKVICDSIPVIHTTELKEIKDCDKVFVIINTVFFAGLGQMQIANTLFEAGIKNFYAIDEKEKPNMRAYVYNWVDKGRKTYYREHYDALCHTYEQLYDDKSREVMLEYIRAYMQADSYNLPSCDGRVKYFFGENHEEQTDHYEGLYIHNEDEVWVNCGSNIGDSIFLYFANGLNAKNIYAFEGNRSNYMELCSNLRFLPPAYQDKVITVNQFIDKHTNFDKVLGNDKITLLNADIEGNELELLEAMSERIKADRPVIAVCAYHKAEDLLELPRFIEENLEKYECVLRKYESSIGNWKRTAELVLYAIPRERVTRDIHFRKCRCGS